MSADYNLRNFPYAGLSIPSKSPFFPVVFNENGAKKAIVQSAWSNNANFTRNSPTILSFGQTLGLSSDDLDNLFRLGDSLTV